MDIDGLYEKLKHKTVVSVLELAEYQLAVTDVNPAQVHRRENIRMCFKTELEYLRRGISGLSESSTFEDYLGLDHQAGGRRVLEKLINANSLFGIKI